MGVWLLNTFRSKPPNTAYIKVLKTKAQFGSATVEAAITLPLVILALVSVLSIIRITSTYEMIQHSLNQVAVQLSQYTYISTVTGIKPKHDDLQNNLNNAKEGMKAPAPPPSLGELSGGQRTVGDAIAIDQDNDVFANLI